MLGGRTVRELYELKGKGRSIHGIADDLGISRNTVRKYVRSPGVPKPTARSKRGSKLDAYAGYIDVRLAEGLENCVVLLREIQALGYDGGYTTRYGSRQRPASRHRWPGEWSATRERTPTAGLARVARYDRY